ncbi:MAG: UdgX family uracil-DNA binding protein [Actinomycetes bacterium]
MTDRRDAPPAADDGEVDGAAPFVPAHATLTTLREAVQGCRGCELYRDATQAVFGKGTPKARLMLVGEQPGDQEDRTGEPFVGPAGRLLDKALADAGIDPELAYVTNTVKHFRFSQDAPGKRRIHQTPELRHMEACRPWLAAEIEVVQPSVVVALGATAAKAVISRGFKVTKQRGQLLPQPGPDSLLVGTTALAHVRWFLGTVHPSSVLRAADRRDEAYGALVADLAVVASVL